MNDDQLGDMKSLIRKDALAKIFAVLLLILMFNASTGFMENVISENRSFKLSVEIVKIDINGLKVHLEGRAQGINFPGQLDQYQVQIDWGDGNTDLNSTCDFTLKDLDNDERKDDFEGSWFSDPDHTYATYGNYTIKVKLYHQKESGAESSEYAVTQITIQLVYADLSIMKSGPLYAHVGDTITYTFNITNLGQYDAENVTVKDSLLGDIYGPEYLAAYTSKLFTIEYHVKGDDPDQLISIASITSDTYDPDEENNEASWAVTILRPAIAIKKSADKTNVHAGDVITYIYNITNPGNEPLKNIIVVDNLGMNGSYVSGDIDNDGWLDPDEFWIFSATYEVKDEDPDPLKNTATVSGSCEHNRTVTATTQLEVRKIRQYNITFDQQGLDGTIDGSSALLTVNGTDIYELPFSMLVDEGEIIVFSYSTNISSTVEGKRFILKSVNASSPLIADGSKLIIGEYKSQYQLTLSVHPLGAGSITLNPQSSDGWYDSGTFVTATAVSVSDYIFDHWELDHSNTGSSNPINVTMNSPHNLTVVFSGATYVLTVYVNDQSVGGYVQDYPIRVDGTEYKTDTSGKVQVQVSYGSHTVEILTPTGYNVRFLFLNWSDGSTDNPRTINVTGDTTLNAYVKRQYYLTIQASPSSGGSVSPSSGWYDHGSSVQINATPASGWAFDRWVGLGTGSYSGTSAFASITINAPINETAYFYTFLISVSPSNGSIVAGESVTATVTVTLTGGCSSKSISLSASEVPPNASSSFNPSNVTISPSSTTANSAMTISTSKSTPTDTYTIIITGSGGGITKTTAYTLTVTATIYIVNFYIYDDAGNAVSGATLVFAGSSHSHGGSTSVTADPYSLSTGNIPTGYRFKQWETNGSISVSSPTSNSTTATVSGSGSITMRLQRIAAVTFSVNGMILDASGTVLTVDGVNYTYADLPKSFTWNVDSSHSFSWSEPVSAGSGKRYVWVSTNGLSTAKSDAITIPAEGGSVNATYKTQYQLTTSVSPSGAGSISLNPSSSDGWYDAGTSVTATVNSASGYVFDHWDLDGATYTSSTLTFTMNSPRALTAYFTSSPPPPPQTATVTFSVNGLGTDISSSTVVLVVDGANYYLSDLPKSFTWSVGSSHSFEWKDPIASSTNGKCYAWVSTSGMSTARSGSINVPSGGGLVNATYKTQYYLTVISPYDTPGGEGWYNADDEVCASLATGIVNLTSGMRAVFVGWSGDASGNNLISDPIVMNAPKTAVANWVIQWFINVEVTPEEAGSIPGEGWYENCTTITFEAPEYLPSGEETSDVRYRFDYWEVDGERFESNIISVHANTSHTIISHYVIQYRVIFNQTGLDQSVNEAILTVNGSAKRLEGLPLIMWVDYGSLINYVYEENVSSSISGKQFRLKNITGPSSPLRVTEPANVAGNYQTFYYLSVISQYGDPYGSGWYPFNSEASFSVTTPVDHGNRTLRVFLKWHGDVSIFEPKGAIIMIKPSAVVASWETQYLLTFNTTLPNKYVLRVPGVPEILPPDMDVFGMYYPVGERVEVGPAPTIVPGSEGIRYTFAGWILDGELFTHNANMSFVIKKPHDVAVLYDTECLLSVNAVGVSDPFISTITISSGSSLMRELTPSSSIQEWFKKGANLALIASTPNRIGHGEWAIFKEWAGHLQAVNRTILLTMLSPMNLNVVFFKVNPVAESIPYSIIAGLISMLLCVISAKRRSSNSKKSCSAASGIIVSAVALLVAAVVSIIVATRYGININELLDFTNWAVIFLIIEAVMFALTTMIIVRKLQH